MRAETEDLKAKVGVGASQVEENEEARRELANREALLQANQRQLQDTLTRNAHEASLREDGLRAELADMRRRWQDATQRAEAIAADVHESTAPLLRQIRALQEEGRARAQAWAQAEATFMDRTATAEEASRAAATARSAAEERSLEAAASSRTLEAELRDVRASMAVAQADCKAAQAREKAATDRVVEAEAELAATTDASRRGTREAKAREAKLKLQAAEAVSKGLPLLLPSGPPPSQNPQPLRYRKRVDLLTTSPPHRSDRLMRWRHRRASARTR